MSKISRYSLKNNKSLIVMALIVFCNGQRTKMTALFDKEHDKYIIENSATEQYFARSHLECASHCLDTLDCCKLSFMKENGECIVDKNIGCSAITGNKIGSSLIEKKYDCGTGWQIHNGRCILYTQTKMSWHHSASFCNSNGGQLFIIRTLAENTWLRNAAQNNNPFIGAKRVTNNTMEWNDGTGNTFPVGHTFWQPGEPNGQIGYCIIMRRDTGGWNDIDCNKPTQTVICEKAWP